MCIFLNVYYEEFELPVVEKMIFQGGRRPLKMKSIITILNTLCMEEVLNAVLIVCVILVCQLKN